MTVSLRSLNTLRVESEADDLIEAISIEDVESAVHRSQEMGTPLTVLGGGSNVILCRRVRGLVLLMRNRDWHVESTTQHHVRVWAGAGMNWHALTKETLEKGWSGLENLSLIPGTVGAAPIQNIGAYGVEVGDRVERVDTVDIGTGARASFDNAECRFGYRSSRFKMEPSKLIFGVVLRLDRSEHLVTTYPDVSRALADRDDMANPTARQIAAVVSAIRRSKLPSPDVTGNVGSFFKNPIVTKQKADALSARIENLRQFPAETMNPTKVKLAAAQLIDMAGWKGRQLNGVGVWATQPLVLVNLGTTRGSDFLVMASAIQTDVEHRFGVALELEPVVLGYD